MVAAAVTTVHLVNRGQQLHHIQLVRVEGGHTSADLLRIWEPGAAVPRWMTGVGRPTAAPQLRPARPLPEPNVTITMSAPGRTAQDAAMWAELGQTGDRSGVMLHQFPVR